MERNHGADGSPERLNKAERKGSYSYRLPTEAEWEFGREGEIRPPMKPCRRLISSEATPPSCRTMRGSRQTPRPRHKEWRNFFPTPRLLYDITETSGSGRGLYQKDLGTDLKEDPKARRGLGQYRRLERRVFEQCAMSCAEAVTAMVRRCSARRRGGYGRSRGAFFKCGLSSGEDEKMRKRVCDPFMEWSRY